MARQPITSEQWAEARALWQADPKISYSDIGETLGVSKQAVAKRAKAENWIKTGTNEKIAEKAQQAADRRMVNADLPLATNAVSGSNRAAEVDDSSLKSAGAVHVEAEAVDTSNMSLEQRAEAIAIAKRAQILERHRNEANALRNNLYTSIQKKDFELGKCAKINAEAMQIIHNIERKAWGLDVDPKGGPPNGGGEIIVIERG